MYEQYYIIFPLKILNSIKDQKLEFFYPSSSYIDINNKSIYSKYKLRSEIMLRKFKKNNIIINIARLPGINTKQNLSLIPQNLDNFRNFLVKNKYLFNKFFFK